MSKKKIVVAGHICIDISPAIEEKAKTSVEKFFIPGRLITLDGVTFSSGGVVANTGFALNKLGVEVLPLANVGNDDFGRSLQNIVKKEINKTMVMNNNISTSYSIVIAPAGIDRIIMHDPAGNDEFSYEDIDYNAIKDFDLFHFGYPTLMKKMYINNGDELKKILKKVKELGLTTSLDMTLPDTKTSSGKIDWERIMKNVLPYTDIFVPSVEEALYIFDRDEYNRIKEESKSNEFTDYLDLNKISKLCSVILELGCSIAMIKCGEKGIYIKTSKKEKLSKIGKAAPKFIEQWEDKEIFEESFVVENFKSALAAGDTAIAGFLAALINDYSIYDSVKIACKSGGLCCSTYDAASAVEKLEKVYEKAINDKNKNKYNKIDAYFRYNEEKKAWEK